MTGSVNPGAAIGIGVLLVGGAAWLGAELAPRAQPASPPERPRFLIWAGALVVGCMLYGGLIGVLTVRYVFIIFIYSTAVSWTLLLGGMMGAAFVLGWVARRYSGGIAWLAGCIAGGMAVIVTVAAGFGMGAAIFLTYHGPTCVGHVPSSPAPLHCVNYGPPPPFIPAPGSIPDLTFAGLVAGLWLAGIIGPAIFVGTK